MAEQLLDRAEVGAAVEQVGRGGVAEGVRPDGAADDRAEGARHEVVDRARSEPGAARAEEQRTIRRGRSAAGDERRPAAHEIGLERLRRRQAVRHDALLVSLSGHARGAAVGIEVVDVEAAQLRDAHRRAVEELEDGVIAQRDRVAAGGRAARARRAGRQGVRGGHLRERPPALRRDEPEATGPTGRARAPAPRRSSPRAAAVRRAIVERASPRLVAAHSHSRSISRSTSSSSTGPALGGEIGQVRRDRRARWLGQSPDVAQVGGVRLRRLVDPHAASMPASRRRRVRGAPRRTARAVQPTGTFRHPCGPPCTRPSSARRPSRLSIAATLIPLRRATSVASRHARVLSASRARVRWSVHGGRRRRPS